jgi:phosphoribosylformylglycinamidine synthase
MSFLRLYKDLVCYNIQFKGPIDDDDLNILKLLIKPSNSNTDQLNDYVEYGPYLHITTNWSSNCQSILEKIGIKNVERIEKTHLIPKTHFNIDLIDPMIETIYDKPLTSLNIHKTKEKDNIYYIDDIKTENKKSNLCFDDFDIEYYEKLFNKLGRNPSNLELHDLAQSNSEHARHWFFKGLLVKDGINLDKSLFQMVKDTQKYTNNNSLVAFHDNSSVYRGFDVNYLCPNKNTHKFELNKKTQHFTFTAETHNFPTSVCPFQGATTGTGGRIRDNQCVGRGGLVNTGIAGYCVGELDKNKSDYWKKNLKTIIEASNGASDYGNKFGEPLICGFTRVFKMNDIEWVKPIMFSGGSGQINEKHVTKNDPEEDMLVVKIGGPAFRIGFGGGAASSQDQNSQNIQSDLNAVQRGDPEMENRMNRLLRSCIELGDNNPIQNANDQGAGGTANATKEIVYPQGANIYLNKIIKSDSTMSALETWICEYQENNTILVKSDDLCTLNDLAKRENVDVAVIGNVTNDGDIRVFDNDELVMNMPLEPIVGNMPQKKYTLDNQPKSLIPLKIETNQTNILELIKKVLELPTVGSKRFLVNKVDRSVTGLVAQQQCVGQLQMPLSNYSITAQTLFDLTGSVTSIGEQPIKGLINPEKMARLTLGEMLTNMVFAKITQLSDIRFSANWMWPLNFDGEKNNIYLACNAMCEMAKELTIAADRGKDSLSMSYKDKNNTKTIKCPGSLVISGYAPMTDIRNKVTPHFKRHGSNIYYLSFNQKWRLGASSLAYIMDQLGDDSECPDIDSVYHFGQVFLKIQKLISEDKILAGHDISDGGFISTICEMAFAGDMGFNIKSPENIDIISFLFSEEPGLIMEITNENEKEVKHIFGNNLYCLGKTTDSDMIVIRDLLCEKMTLLRSFWEKPSYELEKLQRNHDCVNQEYELYKQRHIPYPYSNNLIPKLPSNPRKHKIAIIRDEGTNGDRELASAFYVAGFDVYDLCMNDFILDHDLTLDEFSGIAFAGGFSYSDVCGAGTGWALVLKTNPRIFNIFNEFKNRPDTFSLGICNGCQLMSQLDWIPKCKLMDNKSGKFESRCPFVKINNSNAIMFDNMEDLILPIWVAHGEGQFVIQDQINQIPLQFVDFDHNVTEQYPHNPNGSKFGVAAMCSLDGRHLAMMPHPERCFLNWQIPYDNDSQQLYSPWLQMFINAYQWCESNKVSQ